MKERAKEVYTLADLRKWENMILGSSRRFWDPVAIRFHRKCRNAA